tara:strand:- start:98 stop:622 length:525 start_codon:yes stop_codon:yes gene_type:complete
MKSLNMKNLSLQHVLLVGGVLVLVYAIMQYTNKKGSEGYVNVNAPLQPAPVNGGNNAAPPQPPAAMVAAQQAPPQGPQGVQGAAPDAGQLLPKNADMRAPGWNVAAPQSGGPNLLKAGQFQGIDTVGQSLRNANLQIRAEPTVSKADVGPWLQSTIEPDDQNRVGFVRAGLGCN